MPLCVLAVIVPKPSLSKLESRSTGFSHFISVDVRSHSNKKKYKGDSYKSTNMLQGSDLDIYAQAQDNFIMWNSSLEWFTRWTQDHRSPLLSLQDIQQRFLSELPRNFTIEHVNVWCHWELLAKHTHNEWWLTIPLWRSASLFHCRISIYFSDLWNNYATHAFLCFQYDDHGRWPNWVERWNLCDTPSDILLDMQQIRAGKTLCMITEASALTSPYSSTSYHDGTWWLEDALCERHIFVMKEKFVRRVKCNCKRLQGHHLSDPGGANSLSDALISKDKDRLQRRTLNHPHITS